MHASHHTISLALSELQRWVPGSVIGELFTQERDELIITFQGREQAMLISCRSDLLLLFLHPALTRARRNSTDVLADAAGKTVTELTMHPSDRSFTFILDNGTNVRAQFYGSLANVYLLDTSSTVLDAFKRPRDVVGTRIDLPPAVAMPDIEEAVRLIASAGDQPLQTAVKRIAPLLPPVVIREMISRAGIPPAHRAGACTVAEMDRLRTTWTEIDRELVSPQPRLVFAGTEEGAASGPLKHFSLISLTHVQGCQERLIPDIHEALKEFYVRRKSTEQVDAETHRLRDAVRRRRDRAMRTMAAIREDAGQEDRAARYQQYGSLLMQHLLDIPRGEESWTVDADGTTVTIPLVPSLNAVGNAQRWFEKAKSSQRSHALAADRLLIYASVAERAQALLADLEKLATRHDLKAFMKERRDELEAIGATGKDDEGERVPFRVFTVHGGFEVWAGKSSRDNDASDAASCSTGRFLVSRAGRVPDRTLY